MDIRKVKKLIELLEESGVAEIEIHEGEESVRISRGNSTIVAAPPTTPAAASSTPAEKVFSGSQTDDDTKIVGDKVTAPMVGIFYEALAPGKPSFVELGQSVKKGDVLCIIEAMKIMNQVESEHDGVISKIMVENGDPVEYGQLLFVIREQ